MAYAKLGLLDARLGYDDMPPFATTAKTSARSGALEPTFYQLVVPEAHAAYDPALHKPRKPIQSESRKLTTEERHAAKARANEWISPGARNGADAAAAAAAADVRGDVLTKGLGRTRLEQTRGTINIRVELNNVKLITPGIEVKRKREWARYHHRLLRGMAARGDDMSFEGWFQRQMRRNALKDTKIEGLEGQESPGRPDSKDPLAKLFNGSKNLFSKVRQ
jgi:hypothetical protein